MIAARDGSKDNEDNDCSDSRKLMGYSGKGREVEDEPGENGNNPAPVRSRMSDRTLVQRAKKMSEQLHEKVLAHIGFVSSKEERVRKINEDEENNKGGRVMKKRKKGERPQYLYQAGDKVGRKSFFDALKCFGVFSDSTTIERSDENEMNLNEEEGPRNMAVMMVLNEVSDSSMNGGGAREKCQAKRSKPQFFLVSDNKPDCFKVLTAFKEIFSRDEKENKKDKYELNWLKQDKKSGLLATTIETYIKDKKTSRASCKGQKIVTLEQIEEEIDENLSSTLD